MNKKGYIKKSKDELLKAIDDCISISQLFALVQHEEINMRMQCYTSASSLPPKKPNINPTDSPLDRLKSAVRFTVENTR